LPNSDLKAALQYPNGLTASWSYDANNQLLQVRNATPTNVISQFDYTYDAAGRRTAIAKSGAAFGDLSGATDSYGYNSRNEVISARRTKNNEAIHGFNEDFEYDPIGNRISSTTYNELGEPKTSQYIANNLNQYTSRTVPGYAAVRGHADADATVTVNEKPTYRYGEYFFGSDEFDNFTAPVNAALGTVAVKPGATEDEPDEIASVTNSVYLAKSPVTYEYDEDGNMTEDARFRYYWNGENRMIRAEEKSAPPGRQPYVIAYAYDHMGRNVVNDGAKFIWDDYNVIVEDAASSNATFNTWGLDLDGTMQGAGGVGGLLAVQKGDAVYLPIYDANGNISEYVSSDGVIVAHYAYSSFGKLLMANDEISFTHRFSTKPYCAKTELVEFEFRKYAPNVGRWSSRDVVEFANQYPFVYNSTLVYYEFLGLYGNPVAGPGGINWGPSSPYEPKGPFTPPPPEDTSWAQNLPNCPCNIPIEPSGCPNPTGAGDGWSSPERTGHNGGSWEIRSMPNAAGAGQQCVYDAAGNLINKGSGAGTPDRYSPNGFFYTIKHFIVDVLPYYQNLYKYGPNAAEIFDHRDHPVNPGADSNGYPCPLNDGSDNPPLPCTNCN